MSNAYLHLSIGPMFSEKTTKLVMRLTKYADLGKKCVYLNSVEDTRTKYDHKVSTHSSSFKGVSAKVKCFKTKTLADFDVSSYDYIGVDEAHMFNDLETAVDKWLLNGKAIYVASLDGDAFMKPIGAALKLIPKADEVERSVSHCTYCVSEGRGCNVKAPFSVRLTTDTNQKLVGGADIYAAVCREHHIKIEADKLKKEDPVESKSKE